MSASTVFLLPIAYLATGVALTGYDFAAPPLDKKGYVIRKHYKVAAFIWFAWPLVSIRDALAESHLGRSGLRYFLGVVLLAGGMFLWGRVVVLLIERITGLMVLGLALAFVVLIASSPLLVAISMPPHPSWR